MAKQNDRKTSNDKKVKKSIFKDERIRFTIGLFTVLLSLYLVIAFFSYMFTWKVDQSFEWQSIFSSASVRVDNIAGKVGASFAAQFMNRWFGLSSFAVPFVVLIAGLRLLKIRLLPLRRTFYRSLVGMILLSLVLGYLFEDARGYLGSGLGGAHGLYVSLWLNAFVGKAGTAFLPVSYTHLTLPTKRIV